MCAGPLGVRPGRSVSKVVVRSWLDLAPPDRRWPAEVETGRPREVSGRAVVFTGPSSMRRPSDVKAALAADLMALLSSSPSLPSALWLSPLWTQVHEGIPPLVALLSLRRPRRLMTGQRSHHERGLSFFSAFRSFLPALPCQNLQPSFSTYLCFLSFNRSYAASDRYNGT
jgi:hypothetical protein